MTSEFITTVDHHLAFAHYGKPGGKPLFYFHGGSSSRVQAALAHETALDLGMEIVSPDRPGICESSFVPDRKIIDWPDSIVELAQYLIWDDYGVLCVSGGGPLRRFQLLGLQQFTDKQARILHEKDHWKLPG